MSDVSVLQYSLHPVEFSIDNSGGCQMSEYVPVASRANIMVTEMTGVN